MRYPRLGLGLLMGVGAATLASSGCSSGSTLGPSPLAGRGGTFGGNAGSSGSGGTSVEGGEGGSENPASGGSSPEAGASSGGSSQSGGSGGTGAVPNGAGVGEDCSDGTRCREGLECLDGACSPSGSTGPGEPCVIQPECEADLQCIGGSCVPDGDGMAGEECLLDDDCAAGLRCLISGLTASCVPQGDGDLGAECTLPSDCYAGLACLNGECARQPPGIPLWPGVDCEAPTEEVRAYFEVPGADDADEGDFFRLPFPNDALRSDDGLDLSGFPTPGSGTLGVDPVARYVDALENDDGWGTYSTVYFRFSGGLNVFYDNGEPRLKISWVDVTPDAPERGSSVGLGWYYSGGRNSYLCENWVAVRRPRGYPLLPGHTYAVWITTEVVAGDGSMVRRSPNLVSVLASSPPDDNPPLVPVHAAYAPFRTFLADEGQSTSTVLNAAVFTVGGTRDTMSDLAEAVATLDAPSVQGDWVKCDDGVESPCPDRSGSRDCVAASSAYDEYHALVRLPIFQEGTAPYATPADGGGIRIEEEPETDDVCLSLTVPTGSMPAEGWPLAVFAHGTGGSFRSHVTADIAGALSTGSVQFAVLGIDQVSHGPRRGTSDAKPDDLFFNFLNPAAARGNPLQGAADQISLAKFAATIDGSGDMPTTIDATKLVFFGHSQGATEGSLMLPYADAYRAAVLSGNGASLMNALLTKTEPVDIAGLIPLALSDYEGLTGDLAEYHPVLSLLQTWIDPADPLNFARAAGYEPLEGHLPKHVFQTYGTNDHYSPPITMALYAKAGVFSQVEPAEDDTVESFAIQLASSEAPLSGNAGGGMVTLGMRQYEAADDSDGHFVAFDVPQANEDVVRFLSQAVSGEIPAIGD